MRHNLDKYEAEVNHLQNQTLNDLLQDLKELHYGLRNIKKERDEVSEALIATNMCPKCLHALTIETWMEDRGECFGSPATETLAHKVCLFCDWEED